MITEAPFKVEKDREYSQGFFAIFNTGIQRISGTTMDGREVTFTNVSYALPVRFLKIHKKGTTAKVIYGVRNINNQLKSI